LIGGTRRERVSTRPCLRLLTSLGGEEKKLRRATSQFRGEESLSPPDQVVDDQKKKTVVGKKGGLKARTKPGSRRSSVLYLEASDVVVGEQRGMPW